MLFKKRGKQKDKAEKVEGGMGVGDTDYLIKFVMSIKIFFLIKYYMFLFFFSSILMGESYRTICGMWSIGKINLDRREAQMFSMFNYFFKKTFLVTTLCCRETALWAMYWMSSCAVWGLWESVGAAKPGEERDDLLRTCSWSRHAVLPGCQHKGPLIIPLGRSPHATSMAVLGLALVPPSAPIVLSCCEII